MQRRTRNLLCIWIILGGLINVLVYTVVYASLGGDARNGWKEYVPNEAGQQESRYIISGHFIHGSDEGRKRVVPQWVWIYSFIHSISLWPTEGAMVICMLILARPHIIATMKESTWMPGPTFVTVVITITAVLCAAMTLLFCINFVRELST